MRMVPGSLAYSFTSQMHHGLVACARSRVQGARSACGTQIPLSMARPPQGTDCSVRLKGSMVMGYLDGTHQLRIVERPTVEQSDVSPFQVSGRKTSMRLPCGATE